MTRPFHHGDLRRSLLESAFSILDEKGVDAVSIRAIARVAGVSHAAPANHFKSRNMLLTEMARQIFDQLNASIGARLETAATNKRSRVKAFAAALMHFAFESPNRYRLMWRTDLVDHDDPKLLSKMDEIYDLLRVEFELPRPKVAPDTYAIAFWSMMHGYVDMRLTGMFLQKFDEITGAKRQDAILDVFFDQFD